MKNLFLILLVSMGFTYPAFSQCPPGASAFVSTYPQCPLGCGVLLKDWPEGVIVNVYGGSPISIITSAVIPGTLGGPGLDGAFVCVPCNIPLLFASAVPGATYGCVIYALGTVPVKLTNFSLSTTNTNSCLLKWRASNDQGSTKYTIQKSTDSRNFSDVATLISNNNSYSGDYIYGDPSLQQGISFYRIRVTEVTGHVSYSEIAMVKNQPNLGVSIYPNPVESNFKVTVPSQFLPAKITIYNSVGKAVYATSTLQSTTNLSVNDQLTRGIYAVRVTGVNNSTVTQTILIK